METVLTLLFWGGMIFLMMRFGCGSHMFRSGQKKDAHSNGHGGCCGVGQKDAGPSKKDGQYQSAPPEKDADPVCGDMVVTKNAKTSVHNGLVYYFCSGQCRESFEADPSSYIAQENQQITARD